MILECHLDAVRAVVPECVTEVLETMFFADATPGEPLPGAEWRSAGLLFEGQPSGTFSLWVSRRAAIQLAAGFLGLEEDEVDDGKADQTVAELANMFCGRLVSRVETGGTFRLSTPRPLDAGPDPGAQYFAVDGGVLAVSLRFRPPAER